MYELSEHPHFSYPVNVSIHCESAQLCRHTDRGISIFDNIEDTEGQKAIRKAWINPGIQPLKGPEAVSEVARE